MGRKGWFTCEGKTLLAIVKKLLTFKRLLTTHSNVLPLHLKQTFLPIIWIFIEGDRIESRLHFKIFSTLMKQIRNYSFFFYLPALRRRRWPTLRLLRACGKPLCTKWNSWLELRTWKIKWEIIASCLDFSILLDAQLQKYCQMSGICFFAIWLKKLVKSLKSQTFQRIVLEAISKPDYGWTYRDHFKT